MQSYWFSGKNFDFVYLYSLVEQAATYRSIAAEGHGDESSHNEERGEAEDFVAKTQKFFDSFGDLAKSLWRIISGPYEREAARDMKDFVVDENTEEQGIESSGNIHRMLDRELSQSSDGLTQEDRDRLARYESEELHALVVHDKGEGEEAKEESDALRDSDSEEENEELQNVHTSSSSEDEWERDIKSRRKAKAPSPTKIRKRVSRTSSRAAATESHLPQFPPEASRSISEGSRKRLVIQESDEE